jgi:hypothetical protein
MTSPGRCFAGSISHSSLMLFEQRLGERTATALGEDRLPRVQLDARLERVGLRAVLRDAHVAGRDAADAARVVVEHLGGGEAGIDLDPERLGLAAEPAAEVPEADDVVAVIRHLRRRRQPPGPGLGEEEEPVLGRGRIERCAELLPVREQLGERARLQHCTGEDVCADLRALLEQAHRHLAPPLLRELLEADRAGEAGRPAADDHHVVLHRLAFHGSRSPGGRRAERTGQL